MGYRSFLVVASKMLDRDFPGGPVVKTLHFQCRRGQKIKKKKKSWTKVSEGKALNRLVNLVPFV